MSPTTAHGDVTKIHCWTVVAVAVIAMAAATAMHEAAGHGVACPDMKLVVYTPLEKDQTHIKLSRLLTDAPRLRRGVIGSQTDSGH